MIEFLALALQPQHLLFYIFAYAIAAIPTAFLLSKAFAKVDIRSTFSKSHTPANVWRSTSKKLGVLAFVLDLAKGFIPCSIAYSVEVPVSIIALIGLVCVIGDCFSIWLRFSGGKGAAPACGAMLVVFWPAGLVALISFFIITLLGQSAALGSVIACIVGVLAIFFGFAQNKEVWLIVAMMAVIVIARHRENFLALMKKV